MYKELSITLLNTIRTIRKCNQGFGHVECVQLVFKHTSFLLPFHSCRTDSRSVTVSMHQFMGNAGSWASLSDSKRGARCWKRQTEEARQECVCSQPAVPRAKVTVAKPGSGRYLALSEQHSNKQTLKRVDFTKWCVQCQILETSL